MIKQKLKVFCLTLERTKFRRELFIKEWIKVNRNLNDITFVYGIDGSKEEIDKYQYTNYLGHFISNNVLACGLSHLLILKKISESDPRKFYIIVEDDTILDLSKVRESYDKIDKLTSNGIVYFFCDKLDLADDGFTINFTLSMAAFTLKPNLAKKIYDNFIKNGFDTHIDLSLMYRIKTNRYYLPFAYQLPVTTTMSSKNEKFILKPLQSLDNDYYYNLKVPLINLLNVEFNLYNLLILISLLLFCFFSSYFFYFEQIIFFIFGLLIWDVLEKITFD